MSGHQHPPVPENDPENRPGGRPGQAPDETAAPYGGAPDAGRLPHENFPTVEAPRVDGRPAQAPGWGAQTPPSAGGWGGSGHFASGQSANGQSANGRAGSGLWTRKRGLMAAGAAVVLVAGAGAAGYALSNATAGAASPGVAGADPNGAPGGIQGGGRGNLPNGARGGQGGPGNFAADGFGGMGNGISAAVHSEYVISENGSYVTKVGQLGTVTDISAGSVTVRSDDGFSRTYALGSNVAVTNAQQRRQQAGGTQSGGTTTGGLTVADIVAGSTVRIVAGKDGANFSAETVQLVAPTSAGTSN
jgi:hypothetical protein